MDVVNVYEAKSQLSKLLARVERGESIVIARGGRPVALLKAIDVAPERRVFGKDRGLFEFPEDFDEPLPPDILKAFAE